METSLHRQLKEHYAGPSAEFEVPLDGYRIDIVNSGRLVEVQHGQLSAIRAKIRQLLASDRRVTVVKPIIARKTLVKLDTRGGEVVSRRLSPKRGRAIDLFRELVHFTDVFPHRRLVLELALVEVEELRYPGHGRRRRWRRSDFEIEDQRLVRVRETQRLKSRWDAVRLLGCELPGTFDTAELAETLGVQRWFAQQIAYSLRQIDAIQEIDRRGNTRVYRLMKKIA